MKRLFLFLLIIQYFAKAQYDINNGIRIFHSLEEANEVDPDSVLFIDLGNHNLKIFPLEILKFKKLSSLSFYNSNIGEIYMHTPWLLTSNEKDEAERIFKKYPDLNTDVKGIFPMKKKTKIRKIPNEIIQLKELRIITFSKGQLSNQRIRKLKKHLPNCEIIIL